MGTINNISSLVQLMVWHRAGQANTCYSVYSFQSSMYASLDTNDLHVGQCVCVASTVTGYVQTDMHTIRPHPHPHPPPKKKKKIQHYDDVIMGTMASQITCLASVYSTVYSAADQRKYQSSASLAFVWGIHRDRWIPRTNGQ